jgi:hypothetical protein
MRLTPMAPHGGQPAVPGAAGEGERRAELLPIPGGEPLGRLAGTADGLVIRCQAICTSAGIAGTGLSQESTVAMRSRFVSGLTLLNGRTGHRAAPRPAVPRRTAHRRAAGAA